jgi:DNA invertase Pin-like site-specific DNA recombinase
MLLARTIKHEPSDAELGEFLAHCQDLAGERLYIPQRQPDADQEQRIRDLRAGGWSIRKIAREVSVSKSNVHRALSQNPDLFVDSNP